MVTYNWVWSMGFLNYLFALNLMLMAFAVWLQVRGKSGMLPPRYRVSSRNHTVVLACHRLLDLCAGRADV